MKKNFKQYWPLLLLVIPFVFICIQNKTPDNDIWFILNNGKYLFAHGIPHTDPFTIHEGLKYAMQQWMTSRLFWWLFDTFGKQGIIVMMYAVSIALLFSYYKLLYIVTESRSRSAILTAIAFVLIRTFVVTRPQIFTFLFLILELIFLELYIKKKNWRYLIPLPIISVFLANMHSAMWTFQFIFMLPYLFNTIKIKNVTRDEIKLKPLLVAAVMMCLTGLINPYGIEGLTYITKSYGFPIINKIVKEMAPLSFEDLFGKIMIGLIFILLMILAFRKDMKLDIRHFLFICGVTLLGFMHLKGYPYFILIYFFCLAYLTKNLKIKDFTKKNKYTKALWQGTKVGLCLILPATFVLTVYYSFNNYNFRNVMIEDVGDYLMNNYKDTKDIVLYVDFDNGGYTEYLGIKSYIDPRAELFLEKFNQKKNILLEFYAPYTDKNFDYGYFIDSYDFTHLIVDVDSNFDDYLKTREDFELVFTQNSNIKRLYVMKDFGKENENKIFDETKNTKRQK